MPKVKKGEKRNSYQDRFSKKWESIVSRAIKEMMSVWLTPKQSLGKAEGMYDSKRGLKKKKKKKHGK